MNRRRFLKAAALLGVGVAGGFRAVAALMPEQVSRAVKSRFYPGKLKSLSEKNMTGEGKWLG